MYWAAGSEAYVTPVADDTVGVAVLGGILPEAGAAGGYDARLAAFPALRERLAGGVPGDTGARRGAAAAGRPARGSAGRVLLVGDAAGYIDALTGEGIGAALAQADVLALPPADRRRRLRAGLAAGDAQGRR